MTSRSFEWLRTRRTEVCAIISSYLDEGYKIVDVAGLGARISPGHRLVYTLVRETHL